MRGRSSSSGLTVAFARAAASAFLVCPSTITSPATESFVASFDRVHAFFSAALRSRVARTRLRADSPRAHACSRRETWAVSELPQAARIIAPNCARLQPQHAARARLVRHHLGILGFVDSNDPRELLDHLLPAPRHQKNRQ